MRSNVQPSASNYSYWEHYPCSKCTSEASRFSRKCRRVLRGEGRSVRALAAMESVFLAAACAVPWLRFVTKAELRACPWFGCRWALLVPSRVCLSAGSWFFSRVAVAGHLSAGGQCFCITWAFLALPCHPSLIKLCVSQPTRFFVFLLPLGLPPQCCWGTRVAASRVSPTRCGALCGPFKGRGGPCSSRSALEAGNAKPLPVLCKEGKH